MTMKLKFKKIIASFQHPDDFTDCQIYKFWLCAHAGPDLLDILTADEPDISRIISF